jgi:hypothetical protein
MRKAREGKNRSRNETNRRRHTLPCGLRNLLERQAGNDNLLQTGVALKNSLTRKCAKNFAIGSPTSDVLSSPRHFLPPNFGCFEEKGLFQHPQAIALKTPRPGHE